jgi:phenylpropionate dioxygenase-like ring-hydroxylating dioxygenase large terminal subunit
MIDLKDFWYIAAEKNELKKDKPLARTILSEWVVLYRDENGRAVALRDKCLHRGSQLSRGRVQNGQLVCGYHGWHYDGKGQVVKIPSEGPQVQTRERCAHRFDIIEQDNYVYVRLNQEKGLSVLPFRMPSYEQKGYSTIRLQNLFANNVTNCAENFVDIPHTTFVHPNIFRNSKDEKFGAKVLRSEGSVLVQYSNETKNFGFFSWFLNPKGKEIEHTDEFLMPNVTSVHYKFGDGKHFIITSQSVPIEENKTLVYTDLTYNYGIWNLIARPIIKWQAQKIIDQDIEILNNQMKTIKKYGLSFQNSKADIIHSFIESIQFEIEQGRDPRQLPKKEVEIEFWV